MTAQPIVEPEALNEIRGWTGVQGQTHMCCRDTDRNHPWSPFPEENDQGEDGVEDGPYCVYEVHAPYVCGHGGISHRAPNVPHTGFADLCAIYGM